MNVKMEARTWEQLLFILLQITQLTLPENPPRKREDTLGMTWTREQIDYPEENRTILVNLQEEDLLRQSSRR